MLVKYDNSINYLNLKNFTKTDGNFFFSIIGKMYDVGGNEVIFTFEEIRKMSGYTQTSNDVFAKDLRRMSKKLASTVFEYEDDEIISFFTLFNKFTISKTKETVLVQISENFLPLLNNLKKKFTIFDLKQYIKLESKHSKRLFNIIKQWKQNGETQFYKAEELKDIFGCESYTNRNFINLVLNPAVKELLGKECFKNLKLVIVRDEHKRGRPLKGYMFTFEPEKPQKKLPEKTTNKFNNFAQHEYDFDVLESQILSN